MRRTLLASTSLAAVALGIGAWWLVGADTGSDAGRPTSEPTPAAEVPMSAPLDVPAAAPDAPNVVFVIGCTVRRDQLGAYGGPEGLTPWLDGVAADGVAFDGALSVSSWTRASVTGLLTGRHPASLGLPEPGPRQSQRVLPAAVTTLAEHLAAGGWQTFGVTANPNLNVAYGMAQGMDGYQDSHDKAFRRDRMTGEEVVERGLAFLDARAEDAAEQPFYLQLTLIDAHEPRPRQVRSDEPWASGEVPSQLAVYRAKLHEMDRALARLEEGLEARGLADDTLLVFVADHGEGLDIPAHHGQGHGKKMYETTVGIPWLVRGPGVPAGVRVQGLASGVDVLPTVLSLLDRPGDDSIVGQDLAPWVRGERSDPLPRTRAYAASMFHVANVASVWTTERQCQAWFPGDRDKVVDGCFDRQRDPGFAEPLELSEELEALREELVDWREARLAEGAAFEAVDARTDEEQMEQLKLLGYVE